MFPDLTPTTMAIWALVPRAVLIVIRYGVYRNGAPIVDTIRLNTTTQFIEYRHTNTGDWEEWQHYDEMVEECGKTGKFYLLGEYDD